MPARRLRTVDSTLPNALEAERNLLGGILLDPSKLEEVRVLVGPRDFYHPTHGAIFAAMVGLADAGKPIDHFTVAEQMRVDTSIDLLKAFDGPAYFSVLTSAVFTVENLAYHARAIRRTAAQRQAAELLEGARKDLLAPDAQPADLLADLQVALREIDQGVGPQHPQPPPTVDTLLHQLAVAPPQRTYPSGIAGYDALTGGLHARQLVVICAPTGAGKTSLIADSVRSLRHKIPVLWVATEIDSEEMAARFAALELGDPPGDYLAGRASAADAAVALAGWPVHIIELDTYATPDPFATLRAHAEAIRARCGQAPAVVIDYVQMLAVEDPDRRRLSVSGVANHLRRLARDLDVPVIGISSVSRAYYGTAGAARKMGDAATAAEEDPRAWLASAKESGDVEYAAAVVAYLDTSPAVDQFGDSAGRLIVAKSRRGRCGFVGLRFNGPTGRWTEQVASLDAMGPAARAGEDERRVLDALTRQKQPVTRSEVRGLVAGLAHARVDGAVQRLLDRGAVVDRAATRPRADGRQRAVVVLVVPGLQEVFA